MGDSPTVNTGFGVVSKNILTRLADRWKISVLGINYNGDPHDLPMRIYPAAPASDLLATRDYIGIGRIDEIIDKEQPDIVCVNNDPNVVGKFLQPDVPFVSYLAVDAPNFDPEWIEEMNNFRTTIFYTSFGETAARAYGFNGISNIIPHGINRSVYYPMNKASARKSVGFPADAFIVGIVGRNTRRKRFDLALQAFKEFLVTTDANAYLYCHSAFEREGINIPGVARDLGIGHRVLYPNLELMTPTHGVSEDTMRALYSSFDVQICTSDKEGWCLPVMEGMACGVPQIVPHWSAFSDWANGYVYSLPVENYEFGFNMKSTLGAVPSVASYAAALKNLYDSSENRQQLSKLGLECVSQPQYEWDNIATKFHETFRAVVEIVDLEKIAAAKLKEA